MSSSRKTPVKKHWTPSNWASLKPFGIGEQRPNNWWEVIRAVWENRRQLPYAWRILSQGVCDGCALGTTGIHDWTLDGIHLCNIRLRLLNLNTMGPLDESILNDVESLKSKRSYELRTMGRLSHPMIRRKAERGFRRASWNEALDIIAERIRSTDPDRCGFYLTSRGMPNESYYAAQKAARAIGTNNIDNAARVCHSPSTIGLKATLGVAATTCSYSDWLESDLIVFVGSNVANNQPVATKYLHFAKKNGAKIAVINTYREPGMERYWIPSLVESSLFGTKIADRFFLINGGGDIAFLNGVLKQVIANGALDEGFVREHTNGFDELKSGLEAQSWEMLEAESGVSRVEMQALAQMIAEANKAVFVWSMGITQHEHGVANVMAIINLALTKGFVGRRGCGCMPIRGHSGVQGGAEMGCYSTVFPGGTNINAESAASLSEEYGFTVPDEPGKRAVEMIEAAHAGELDVLFSAGGNFLEVLPDPKHVEESLERVPLRIHMDIVLSPQMLVEPADTVVLLPAQTRYEIRGGVTQTSTERRVMFSPHVPGPKMGKAKSEWQVLSEIASRVRPEIKEKVTFKNTAEIREEIARVIPYYEGIQHLRRKGDQFQYGGPHLCADWQFPTSDRRASFIPIEPPRSELPEGHFFAATRRGKQFNSMVHEKRDSLNGAEREAVLISALDAKELGVHDGESIILRSEFGEYSGRVCIAPVKPRNVQIHWPEGNVLIGRKRRSPEAGVPDYSAVVTIEKTRGKS